MGLTKQQMDQLVNNIQDILDNPVLKIEWNKVTQEFAYLLEQDIEYDEEEIQYVERKLTYPEDADPQSIYVIANDLLTDYQFENSITSQIPKFEKENPELVDFLKTLKFPRINIRLLSYQTDHWLLMDGFEKLLSSGIEYNMDDVKNWLQHNRSNSLMEDNVIDEVSRIAEYTQMRFKKPS